jgi:anaerobic magnesium-protoporphyrin IX monomethyl ester cyclase
MKVYRPPATKYRRLPTFSVITSRGCPFTCSFCCNVVHGRKLRQRSVANVMQELYLLRDSYGATGIIFQDSSLCQNRKWMYDLCDAMIASGINLEWSCLSRVEQVDYQLLARMKQAGCWQISYGIESGNQKTLDFLRKNNTLVQIEAAVAVAHKAGIQVRATYMLAVPGETREDILNTIRFAKKLGTMFASFQVTVPLPGTPLYEDASGIKGITPQSLCWEDYNFFNKEMPFYIPEGMSREELIGLCEKTWISYYLSLRVILRHVSSIRSFADIPKYFAGIVGLAKMASSKYLFWRRTH